MGIRHAYAQTRIGDLLLVADEDAITGVYFEGHWYPPDAEAIGEHVEVPEDPVFAQAARELREYLAGARKTFDVRVRTQGDPLSEQVWQRLKRIPYGETSTYGTIAQELGNRNLAQRVGQAVGHNPISIIIPCHRVLGADGSLTGFAGGLERKRALLELEEPEPTSVGRLF